MKKFKLFALAVFAMLSTNVFAALTPKSGNGGNGYLQYSVEFTPAAGTTPAVAHATVTGFTDGVTIPETIVIPDKVEITTKLEGDAAASTHEYTVVGITATAFAKVTSFTGIDIQAESLVDIPKGAFVGTNIASLDLTKTKVVEINPWFTNQESTVAADKTNNKLAEVKLYKNWTNIAASAFEGCSALTTVNFGAADSEETGFAQSIEKGAFFGTNIATLDLSTTQVTTINPWFTKPTSSVAADKTNAKLTEVKLYKNWTTIAESAFVGCSALTTIDFGSANSTAAGFAQAIPAGAFIGTGLTSLNLSGTKIKNVNRWFTSDATSTFAPLLSVSLPATVDGAAEETVGIAANAFNGCTNLATVTFAALTTGEGALPNVAAIGAGAFANTSIETLDLTNTKITTLNALFETLGAKVKEIKLPVTLATIGAGAFTGLANLTSLTIPGPAAGAAEDAKVEISENAFKKTLKLETLTLPGKVKINAGAFTTTYLKTLTISGDLAAGAVAEGAFVRNGEQKIKITYKPSASAVATAFAAKSFAEAATDPVYVTFETTEAFDGKLFEEFGATGLYGVDLSASEPEHEATGTITVYNNGGKYAYAGYVAPTGGIKINKKQGTEESPINVMVYGAYFDNLGTAATSAIMMDQMHLIGGYYYLPEGTKFIVKSSSTEPVEFDALSTADTGKDSQNYNQDNKKQNEIQAWGDETGETKCYAIDIIEKYATQTVYFLRDLAGGKEFGWKQRSDDSIIEVSPNNQLFLLYPAATSGAPRLIWLDGSEEDQTTTGIDHVGVSVENNGAIYNVAGQKVSASYKGLVIKNGKKFIQK